jgi:hypothetical protein
MFLALEICKEISKCMNSAAKSRKSRKVVTLQKEALNEEVGFDD